MSLYPNILDISASNDMLAQQQQHHHYQTQTSHLPPSPSKPAHPPHPHHHHQITPTHVSDAVLDFFSHMFAPASYLACTCSTPYRAPASPSPATHITSQDEKLKIVVDDDIVVLEGEQDGEEEDGGPLCREATIASWKTGEQKKERGGSSTSRRRRSLQWLAGVIRRESM
jgi:hypothetical protein